MELCEQISLVAVTSILKSAFSPIARSEHMPSAPNLDRECVCVCVCVYVCVCVRERERERERDRKGGRRGRERSE